jgi:putative FmdB family regulatory protein
MPLYSYECSLCKHSEDRLEKVQTEHPEPIKCPVCGKDTLCKKPSFPTAFHLKGGGWYKDGY